MEIYFIVFINWEQNNWVKLLLISKFAYKNIKNANISYIPFEFNCRFYPQILFKENVNLHSKSCLANKLADKLKELIEICSQNLFYI